MTTRSNVLLKESILIALSSVDLRSVAMGPRFVGHRLLCGFYCGGGWSLTVSVCDVIAGWGRGGWGGGEGLGEFCLTSFMADPLVVCDKFFVSPR